MDIKNMCEEIKPLSEEAKKRLCALGDNLSSITVITEILNEPHKDPRDLGFGEMFVLIKLLKEKVQIAQRRYEEVETILNL